MNDRINQLPTQKTIELPEIDEPLAKAFARAYVDEDKNALKACLSIFQRDVKLSLKMSTLLLANDLVKAAISDAESKEEDTLPSKTKYLKWLWNQMENANTDDAKTKYARLYADARSFIEKPQTQQQTNVQVVVPRVLAQPIHQSDEEWEAAVAKQQFDLIEDAKKDM